MVMPITVVIADDREMVRKAIRKLLSPELEIKIVGEAGDFPETISCIRELNPDVTVMDLHMPAPADFSPQDIKRAVADSGSRLITVSIWQDDSSRALAASFGSFTFLDKSNLATLLATAIKQSAAS
jgi:DNA-binding NarL/FixJ family response regulator